jgi:hypothetical protein
LGLFGEGGGAVDDVGGSCGVPGGGGGEVAVGDADEGTCGEICGGAELLAGCWFVAPEGVEDG